MDWRRFRLYAVGSLAVGLAVVVGGGVAKYMQIAMAGIEQPAWRPRHNISSLSFFELVVFAPLIETMMFLLLGRAMRDWRSQTAPLVYVLCMAVLGFVAHWTAQGPSFGGALSFAAFAMWFWAVATRIGHRWSYVFTTLAHSLANAPFAAIAIATATTA